MKRLLLLLCLLPSLLFGAAGDVVSVTIGPEGYYADVVIEGLSDGGTYDFGLGTNNNPNTDTPKMTFAVTSEGYTDDSGTLGAVARTVYGVSSLRVPALTKTIAGSHTTGTFQEGETVTQATSLATAIVVIPASSGPRLFVRSVTGAPDNSNVWTGGTSSATFTPTATPADYTYLPREHEDGTNLTVRVLLSDLIYDDDESGAGKSGTDVTVNILAGFYDELGGDGGTENNATTSTFAVTNNSTCDYPKVVANWFWPGYQRITGSSFTLRCGAFQRHGQQGRPVRAVKFTATDESAHTVTEWVTRMTWEPAMLDPVPVVEYVATISTSTLTALDTVTCNFVAYPWIGDADSVLDTSAGTAQPTPLYGPITMLNDKSDTYGRTFAAVSSSGNDTTGIAVKREDYASDALADAAAVATPCLTIGGAYAKIVAKNNADRSRNDGGAGEVILTAGNYAWVGAGSAFGTTPECWAIVRPADGVAESSAVIDAATGGDDLKDRVLVRDCTISGTTVYFGGIDALWIDSCTLSSTYAAVFASGCPAFHVTRSDLSGFDQGLRYFSAAHVTAPSIVRGNNLNGFKRSIHTFTCIGNSKTTKDTALSALFVHNVNSGQACAQSQNTIVAYNKILGFNANLNMFEFPATFSTTHGVAIVQNLVEFTDGSLGSAMGDICGSGTATPCDHYIYWHNTNIGQRILRGNNSDPSNTNTLVERRKWSEKNNLATVLSTVQDRAQHGTANGIRVGGWQVLFGVGNSGNLILCPAFSASTGLTEWGGLNTITPGLDGPDPGDAYAQFVDDNSYMGAGATAGLGDYRVHSASPARRRVLDWLIPYDITGKPRSPNDETAGAYAEGGVRPASMFFAQ